MIAQEFTVTRDEGITLNLLRSKHLAAGFSGRCIVRFAPELYSSVLDLPRFRHIDNYRFTKPADENEIGGVEVFHLVPSSPVTYGNEDILQMTWWL